MVIEMGVDCTLCKKNKSACPRHMFEARVSLALDLGCSAYDEGPKLRKKKKKEEKKEKL